MKVYTAQTSFLSGVLDPRASARVETEAYAQGALALDNITPVHLGGVRRRAGLKYIAQLPNKLSRVIAVPTVTVPEGGTAQSANDFDQTTLVETTGNVGTTDPYVVVRYDLGVATSVLFVDVLDIFSTGGSSTEFMIQYSDDDTNWTVFESTLPLVDTQSRSYRRGGTEVSARYWRLAKVGGSDMGAVTISISSFNLWQSTSDVSEVRLFPFEITTEDRYLVALTDRSMSIFEDGEFVRSVPSPYTSEDLAGLDAASSRDTMAIVHEDYEPHFLILEPESTSNFQLFPVDFDEIPTHDFDDSLSPTPTSEVQIITFATADDGDTYQVDLEGARTGPVTFAGDADTVEQSATAENLRRAIQALYTVPGFTGVAVERTDALEYTVTFADASAKAYELMAVSPLSGDIVGTVVQDAAGSPRSEAAWSATRGYPRTVTFYGGRLYFGGTRSLPDVVMGSQVFNILNFEILEGLDDEAIFRTLDGQTLHAIQGAYSGRSLQFFSSAAEFRYVKPQGTAITPEDAPALQTENGAAKVRPVLADGATIFVQRNGKSIRDFRFYFEEGDYNSLGISSLAPHLINDVVDLKSWNGSREDEISLVFVVNGDGTVAVFNTRKEAEVQAWTRWTTQGQFKAAGVVVADIYFAVLRSIAGASKLFLELSDDAFYTDCAKRKTGASSTSVTGLEHLNGAECRVRADNFVLQSKTPAAGAITIERESSDVEVGLNFDPEVTPMPINALMPTGPNFMRKRRIVKVRVKVRGTLGLLCNDIELGDRSYDLNFFDEFAGTFTGVHEIDPPSSWDDQEEKLVTFKQVDPLPLEILAFEVVMAGSE